MQCPNFCLTVATPQLNFLGSFNFEKVSAQNISFCHKVFELHFSKSRFLSIFLTYNEIGVPYGHDFFSTNAKIYHTSNVFIKVTKTFLDTFVKEISGRNM